MISAFTSTATTFVAATSMSAEAEIRGMMRPRVPNYAARRFAAAAVAVAAIALGAVAATGLVASLGSSPASASAVPNGPAASSAARLHVAQPDDTLWSIAAEYRGDVPRSRYIDALVVLNGGPAIQAGQAIWLP